MRLPIIWTFFAERRRYRHLRHDRRAAAADQALIGQQDMPGPGARRRDRRVHAGASGPDNQHIGGESGHAEDLVPLARISMIGTAKPSPRRYGAAARTIAVSIAGRGSAGCSPISAAV